MGSRIAVMLTAIVAVFLCTAIQSPDQSTANPQTPAQQPAQPPSGQPGQSQPSAETHAPAQPEFLVVIDPGHGGDDQGASLGDKVMEKDVTLSMARRIRTELQDRGIVARLLRNEDETLDLEQRAQAANEQHASVYLAIHAGTPGSGVRVYAAAMTSPANQDAGKFLPWELAQLPYLPRSRALSKAVANELDKKGVDALSLTTPLRPLNNISAPAIAIELASDRETIQQMLGQKFQSTVAAAVASVVAQTQPQTEQAK